MVRKERAFGPLPSGLWRTSSRRTTSTDEDVGILAHVPLADFAHRTDFYGQDDFIFDPERDEYRCTHPATLCGQALGMPTRKILVEPDHVAVRQAVLTLVRVIPFLGCEVIALDPPEAESRFLVEGDLPYAGVAGANHRAAETAGAQVGQNTRQHPLSQAAIMLTWVDGDRS